MGVKPGDRVAIPRQLARHARAHSRALRRRGLVAQHARDRSGPGVHLDHAGATVLIYDGGRQAGVEAAGGPAPASTGTRRRGDGDSSRR